jgi:Domain of unknown function (DUF4878)
MKIRLSRTLPVTLAICALALAAACKGPATNSNGANTANNANSSNTRPAATTSPAQAPTTTGALSSPTRAFMAFYEASKSGDVEAVKRTLSKGSFDFLTAEAKKENKTLEAALTESLKNADVPKSTPEVRNEKIEGDTATIEVKDEKTNTWDSFKFVRENGEWKIRIGPE